MSDPDLMRCRVWGRKEKVEAAATSWAEDGN